MTGLKRYQHQLKPNLKGEFPRHFLFFDTETTQERISKNEIEHSLRLGSALYWERRDNREHDTLVWYEFTTQGEFWDIVDRYAKGKSRLIIVAHNIAFDMGIVKGFIELDTRGFKLTKIVMNDRCNIWRFRRNTATILCLDNMNYFNLSLKILGDSLGFPKLDMPDMAASNAEWMTYCRQDTKILYEAWRNWHDFLANNDLGNFGLTLASQAMNAFRHRFMPVPVFVHNSTKAVRLERQAYRGGRNECFRIGTMPPADYTMLDVNSMYPAVMSSHEYPCNLRYTGKSLTLATLQQYLVSFCVIADVMVNTSEPCFGVKQKGKLIFPVGRFRATLTTQELLYGLDRGYITKIYDFAVYDKAFIFTDYVQFFYTQRREFTQAGNVSFSFLCKLMLNSLYGKFGQKVDEWKYVGEDPTRLYDYWIDWDVKDQKNYAFRCINHRVEELIGTSEGFNSIVAIAAEVTANARMYLWEMIKDAGPENVFYGDTDSLIVNNEGLHNMKDWIDPDELGNLKVEKTTRHLVLNNLKDYQFGSTTKLKGIRKNAIKVDDNRYKQFQSVGLKGGLHRKEINRVIWVEMIKEISGKYSKGVLLPAGEVKPLIMTMFDDITIMNTTEMVDVYGSEATINGRALQPMFTGLYYDPTMKPDKLADMRPDDRMRLRQASAKKRQAGEMIYQRGR